MPLPRPTLASPYGKGAGYALPAELLVALQRACLQTGTAEQCLSVQADLDASGAPPLAC